MGPRQAPRGWVERWSWSLPEGPCPFHLRRPVSSNTQLLGLTQFRSSAELATGWSTYIPKTTSLSGSILVPHQILASSRVHGRSPSHSPSRLHSSRALPGRSDGFLARQASTSRSSADETS